MERTTRIMNVTSGIVMLVAGIYVQFAFSEVLAVHTRVAICIAALIHVLVCIVISYPSERGKAVWGELSVNQRRVTE